MAKLVFPSVGAPYRGFVGEVRGWFQRIASYAVKSPGSLATLRAQADVLLSALDGRAVAIGQALSLRNYAGTALTPAETVTLINSGAGELTARLASNALLAKSGTKFTIPAPTGSYVNGITLTIVNGAVTAAVLS